MKKYANSSRGMSLVEVIVAIGIISVGMTGLVMFLHVNKQQDFSDSQMICNSLSQSTIETFRGLGYENVTAAANMMGSTGSTNIKTSGVIPSATMKVGSTQMSFPASSMTQPGANGRIQVNSYKAILGSMSALTALYNSNSGYCSANGLEYNSGALTPSVDPNSRIKNVKTYIRIQVIDTVTGAETCPLGPITILPTPDKKPASGLALYVDSPPNPALPNEPGLKLTVTTNYELNNGSISGSQAGGNSSPIQHSCASSAVFRYPRNPVNSKLDVMTFNYQRDPVTRCKASDSGRLTITLAANFDSQHGIVPLCRDTSSSRVMTRQCATGPGSTAFATPTTGWVPCTKVTVCGVSPANSTRSPDGRTITNLYSNLPWGCNIRIEGLNVDPALNVSTFAANNAPKIDANDIAMVPQCAPCPPGYRGPAKCPPSMNNCTLITPPSGPGPSGPPGPSGHDGGPDGGNGGLDGGGGGSAGAGDGGNNP